MKNEKLKSLMARKMLDVQRDSPSDFEVLNRSQLAYAHGGKGSNCPMLTSCGNYASNNCGLKVNFETPVEANGI